MLPILLASAFFACDHSPREIVQGVGNIARALVTGSPSRKADIDFDIEVFLDEWVAANKDGYVIEVKEGELKLFCPESRTCENWAVKGVERITYMSFALGVQDEPTVEGLRKHFNLVSYRLPVPVNGGWSATLDGPCFQCVSRSGEDQRTTFQSYEDGILKMEIRHLATSLVATRPGPGCTPAEDEMDWTPAEGCESSRKLDIPVTIRVAVPMPDPADG